VADAVENEEPESEFEQDDDHGRLLSEDQNLEGPDDDEELDGNLGIEELNAEVNRLLQSIDMAVELESDSESVPVPLPVVEPGSESVSSWYKGKYPLHYRQPMCVQADRETRRKDKERQIRDKRLLERWPRVDGAEELRLLYEGNIP
jgi:hypothetical protein